MTVEKLKSVTIELGKEKLQREELEKNNTAVSRVYAMVYVVIWFAH